MNKKQKVGILSLGCPRSLVDSEEILGRLSQKGSRIVRMDKADIGIVNTCAFIEEAKQESVDTILDLIELKRQGKLKKIIVCGCLSQRYKDILASDLPEVDAFMGTPSLNHTFSRYPLTPRHFGYLKICEGCVNHCSYCAIPQIKGRFTSLDTASILRKLKEFNSQKVSELNIIGQDITGYGIDLDGRPKLPELIKKILQNAPQIGWIRLLYLYPHRITGELLDLISNSPQICKYIDLPIQHISGRILKLMHRQTPKKKIVNLLERIRKRIPDVGVRTSVIVGFPSETEEEFKELLNFIRDFEFERLGSFIYSREEGTAAYNFSGQIPRQIKLERFNALMLCQQEISRKVNRKFLGKTLDVLIEEKGDGFYLGRSQYDAPEVDGLVYVYSNRKLKPGEFARVEIKDTLEYDLVGEVEE